MREEYLWNRQGAPDAEIARLEEALRSLRYEPNALPLSLPVVQIAQPKRTGRLVPLVRVQATRRRWWWLAAGMAAAAASAVVLMLSVRAPESAWKISWNNESPRTVRQGQTVATGRNSATLLSDFVGEVRVEPNSQLRVIQSTKDQQQFALQRGAIHALIWAPPKQFIVDTPSSKTIDLGCQYTLRVTADGRGLLDVQTGWVAFQWHNLESFIPAGAECVTRPSRGPGTPYFRDAPPELRLAVARFDETGNFQQLEAALPGARPPDALTLWHLLTRTEGAAQSAVYDRFAQLVNVPESVTLQKIAQGDGPALDAAWNALGLGNTGWWREWKRRW